MLQLVRICLTIVDMVGGKKVKKYIVKPDFEYKIKAENEGQAKEIYESIIEGGAIDARGQDRSKLYDVIIEEEE
jgi:hypothetical protein